MVQQNTFLYGLNIIKPERGEQTWSAVARIHYGDEEVRVSGEGASAADATDAAMKLVSKVIDEKMWPKLR